MSDVKVRINAENLKRSIVENKISEISESIKPYMDEMVNSEFDLLGNLVKKEGKEIFIENTIGPNEDVIRITYRRGITAGDILVELDMVNDYILADAEGELSLEDVIPSSAELMLIPGSIAGANYHLQERK
ncbi:MAG: hypothetical protein ACFFD7_00855 [Candidatus Thorarchaeota archaeon]